MNRAGAVVTPQGATIAYDVLGDDGSPPLVLIQGFSAQLVGWPPGFCALLAAEGYHVIRFDNRDVGLSQKYPGGGYGVADMAADVAALLDGLGIGSAHIVGQSLGGIIALHLALDHPGRVRSLGLVYTSAHLGHFTGGDLIAERMGVPRPRDRAEFVAAYPLDEAGCASPGYPRDLDRLTELAGQMYDRDHDPDGVARQLQAALSAPDLRGRLAEITVPTAILAGDGDLLIDPAASAELHGLITGSTLTVFPGMGHELPRPLWPAIVGRVAANAAIGKDRHVATA